MWRRKKGRDLLRPYELAVLDAAGAALGPRAGTLLERQVDAIRKVQRLFDDVEVDLYPEERGGRRHDDPAIAFPNRALELKVATVGLRGAEGTGRAVVHAVGGHVFQLAFHPPPKQLGDPASIVVTETTIHAEVMFPDDGAAHEAIVGSLDAAIRTELEEHWAGGTADAKGLLTREQLYTTDLEDGSFLLLGLLVDGSVLVAPIDPAGPGVRRYALEGPLLGTHGTVEEAIEAAHRGDG